ncbi:MAG: hypothetical protein JST80_03845 [Bdellovibrionales bacterium]|nr:hypothetical protein [Bdellovibrionales bacterium]
MAKKKGKFDLTQLVKDGFIKEGETLSFVSDPSKTCIVFKMPNNEFKVKTVDGATTTIHAFAQSCLGQEPPEHAARWVKGQNGKTLYEIWHANDDYTSAA